MKYAHGLTGYKMDKCRCDICSESNRIWARAYRKKTKDKRLAQSKVRSTRGKALLDEKKSVPCADCGIAYPPYIMDFDHLRDKRFNISTRTANSISTLLEEIEKCDVVCSNCHRERTHQRRQTTSHHI